jgi:hypothetical protein
LRDYVDNATEDCGRVEGGDAPGSPVPTWQPNLYRGLGPTTSINNPCGILSRALLCAAMPIAWRVSCKRAARANTVASPRAAPAPTRGRWAHTPIARAGLLPSGPRGTIARFRLRPIPPTSNGSVDEEERCSGFMCGLRIRFGIARESSSHNRISSKELYYCLTMVQTKIRRQ